jgi:transcriptional regulator with XRE-family HTH domain
VTVNPTVRQRELGKRLRELRDQHGLSVEDVAKELVCSAAKVSGFEIGSKRPSLHDVRALCRIYHADESSTAELVGLAREATQQTWWTQYEDLKLDPFLGLEQVATSITSFTTYYVPALLQTEEYARKVISSIAPRMDPDVYRQRVEARMRRQRVLDRSNRPRYRALLDEAVMHRQVGVPALMMAQLDKVLNAAHDTKVTVEVIPFNAGIPAAQDSNFVLLEFGEATDMSPIVFVEGLIGNQYLERDADIARYREAIDYLSNVALPVSKSIARMAELRKFYSSL